MSKITKVIIVDANVKAAQKALKEVNDTLELQNIAIDNLEKNLGDYERQLEKVSEKDANRRTKLIKKIKDTKAELQDEKKALTKLKKERTDNTKKVKEATDAAGDYSGALSVIDKSTGGAASALIGLSSGLGKAGKGFKTLDGILKLSLLGIIVTGVLALSAAFTRSEEGQEKFQRGMAAINAIVNQVLDVFASLGQTIIDAVTNPMAAIEKLGKGIAKFISNPFKFTKEVIDDAKSSVIGFIAETTKEVLAMDKVTKARQKAHHIERDLMTERAEANREISDIRLQAEDRENKSATERIALLRKAQQLEEDITAKEIVAKQLLIDAQELEMEQGLNTIQAKDKLAKLQAELINLDTKKLRSQRLLQTQITTAVREEQAIKDKAAAEAQKVIDDNKAKADKKIEDDKAAELKRLEGIKEVQKTFEELQAEEAAITEEEKAQLDADRAIAELDKLNATEEQKAKIVAYWNGQIEKGRDKDAANDEARDKSVANAKMDIAKQSMALIGQIAGEGSAIGKAMAIGQATISGVEGVQNAFTTANKSPITVGFPAYPFIQAGLAGAFSAVQIAKIASTKADGKGAAASPRVSGAAAAAVPSMPPEFTTVGASDTNQLASAIGQQEPVRAFVVSNDVTTAQGLERNIVEGATI
jgi:hypothetical protein|tara:strand:+ start:6351 stop:8291 length:1941 start_codon:yes stop_codon:yes gene_type:complete